MVVKEDGIYLYSVDSELSLKRITEREFPAYISSKPELRIKIDVGNLALSLGGETKEKLKEGQKPEPENLLIIPKDFEMELEEYKNKTEIERIETLWIFVRQGGYLGLDHEKGLYSATVEQFIERKAGDCSDFSILTYSLGKRLGLNVQIVSLRVAKTLENGELESIGHSFCVIEYSSGFYVLDGAQNKFDFYEGMLKDVFNTYTEELFPGYHVLGDYYVSSGDREVKGLYMAEFGGAYENIEWLDNALEYGYKADYVYFALAYYSYIAGEPVALSLAYLGKISKKDEYSLRLEGTLALEILDLERAEKIGLDLIRNYSDFIGGYELLQEVYQKQENPEKADEIKRKIDEKWPKPHSK